MHIIIINNAYGRFLSTSHTSLLQSTGWAEGVAAGAQVTVFQRYQLDTDLEITNIPYHFITEHNRASLRGKFLAHHPPRAHTRPTPCRFTFPPL
ncbi:MAG: hypothetical protein R3E31_25690 [Chloroflexota bacterium]